MPTSATMTFTGQGIIPVLEPVKPLIQSVVLPPSVTYAKGTVLAQVPGTGTAVDHVQTITITGSPTGGTFTLTYDGQTTAAIAYNAAAAAVESALEALSTVGSGNVTCTGGAFPGTAVVVTFTGDFAASYRPAITASASFTGGTDPAIAVAQTTYGKPADGYFVAYDDDGTPDDGRRTAKAILQYNCASDNLGNITFGLVSGVGDFQQTALSAPAYFTGFFAVSDLTGLDANGVTDLGRLTRGTLSVPAGAILQVGG